MNSWNVLPVFLVVCLVSLPKVRSREGGRWVGRRYDCTCEYGMCWRHWNVLQDTLLSYDLNLRKGHSGYCFGRINKRRSLDWSLHYMQRKESNPFLFGKYTTNINFLELVGWNVNISFSSHYPDGCIFWIFCRCHTDINGDGKFLKMFPETVFLSCLWMLYKTIFPSVSLSPSHQSSYLGTNLMQP